MTVPPPSFCQNSSVFPQFQNQITIHLSDIKSFPYLLKLTQIICLSEPSAVVKLVHSQLDNLVLHFFALTIFKFNSPTPLYLLTNSSLKQTLTSPFLKKFLIHLFI